MTKGLLETKGLLGMMVLLLLLEMMQLHVLLARVLLMIFLSINTTPSERSRKMSFPVLAVAKPLPHKVH